MSAIKSIWGIDSAVNILETKGATDVKTVPTKTGNMVTGKINTPNGIFTFDIHLDHRGKVSHSEIYAMYEGKYLICPVRTEYPSMKRVKLPVPADMFWGSKPMYAEPKPSLKRRIASFILGKQVV